ncbi:coenzyme F420-0:L-glutamate ligase [Naumannella halotolerans]|uniref:coenzyme F420-0:L-glutamate ligase n=1 Tax=Naumannella halotolerans TaxID=993414 RepID=UPI00370D7175
MIEIFAPEGIGEISAGDQLAPILLRALADAGGLRDGDIVCVTSKIISKSEGRFRESSQAARALTEETVETVARRDRVRIVRNRQGIVQAAAGIDSSNVAAGSILLLPIDPDASAARLRAELVAGSGRRVGVLITDTAGRAWRIGQTDQAIGASGVRTSLGYAGQTDDYGNDLVVTQMAVADELAAAADLVKGKLRQCPVAVIRGLPELVVDAEEPAAQLQRDQASDMFARGTREAVLWALLDAWDRTADFPRLVELDGEELIDSTLAVLDGEESTLRRILATIA